MSVAGFWQYGYWNLGLVITPAAAEDFLSALVAYWQADAYLTAIVPTPYLSVAPAKAPKPYVVVSALPATVSGRNTGKGYWQDRYYRVDLWFADADACVLAAEAVITEFDKLITTPLSFGNGYQMGLYLVGDTLERAKGFGPGASIQFPVTLTYHGRVGRNRA